MRGGGGLQGVPPPLPPVGAEMTRDPEVLGSSPVTLVRALPNSPIVWQMDGPFWAEHALMAVR